MNKESNEVSQEMRRYMAEGIDETWYCEHGYYQGFECPNCDVPAWWPENRTEENWHNAS